MHSTIQLSHQYQWMYFQSDLEELEKNLFASLLYYWRFISSRRCINQVSGCEWTTFSTRLRTANHLYLKYNECKLSLSLLLHVQKVWIRQARTRVALHRWVTFWFLYFKLPTFCIQYSSIFISKCEYLLTWIKICVWYHFENTTTSDNELLCELRMMLLDMRFTIYITFCLLKYVKLNWHEDLQCWSIPFCYFVTPLKSIWLNSQISLLTFIENGNIKKYLILAWISSQTEEWY